MFVTVAPSLCAALVVPLTALVIPVNVVPPVTPVSEISSVPTFIKFVSVSGNCVASAKTIDVPELPVPTASFPKAPFKVVVAAFEASPPQDPRPQP